MFARMPVFSVQGHATRHQPAERGTIRLTVQFRGENRASVLAHAARVHTDLVDRAKAHVASGAATWWGSQAVLAWAFDEWDKPSPNVDQVKVRRFRAGADAQVKFQDFAALAAWAAEVAAIEGVAVNGITWALTDARRDALQRDVRADAARDSVERARAYADALGYGDVRLLALFEDGLRPHVSGGGGGIGMSMRGAPPASGSTKAFEMRPDDIVVTAAVTADFEAV